MRYEYSDRIRRALAVPVCSTCFVTHIFVRAVVAQFLPTHSRHGRVGGRGEGAEGGGEAQGRSSARSTCGGHVGGEGVRRSLGRQRGQVHGKRAYPEGASEKGEEIVEQSGY